VEKGVGVLENGTYEEGKEEEGEGKRRDKGGMENEENFAS